MGGAGHSCIGGREHLRETPRIEVKERLVLKKFNGDLTPEEQQTTEPEEVIVVEPDGSVDTWKKGDPRDAPE